MIDPSLHGLDRIARARLAVGDMLDDVAERAFEGGIARYFFRQQWHSGRTRLGDFPANAGDPVIDGGKGQLGVAVEVLAEKKLQIPVVGLAKRIEEIFKPHDSTPIILDHSNPILQLLQRLRDEAHRFAITFHRSRRSKAATKSALDTIPGIGPKTKKLLKQKFGTVARIKAANLDELAAIVGKEKAELLKKYL